MGKLSKESIANLQEREEGDHSSIVNADPLTLFFSTCPKLTLTWLYLLLDQINHPSSRLGESKWIVVDQCVIVNSESMSVRLTKSTLLSDVRV